MYNQSAGPVTSDHLGAFEKGPTAPVQGAPYSATITNESIETLADGNRIVQTNKREQPRGIRKVARVRMLPCRRSAIYRPLTRRTSSSFKILSRRHVLHVEFDRQDRVEKPGASRCNGYSGPASGSSTFFIQMGSGRVHSRPAHRQQLLMQKTVVDE